LPWSCLFQSFQLQVLQSTVQFLFDKGHFHCAELCCVHLTSPRGTQGVSSCSLRRPRRLQGQLLSSYWLQSFVWRTFRGVAFGHSILRPLPRVPCSTTCSQLHVASIIWSLRCRSLGHRLYPSTDGPFYVWEKRGHLEQKQVRGGIQQVSKERDLQWLRVGRQ
jgi:hypothetical protein